MRRYILLTLAVAAGVLAFVLAKVQLQKHMQRLDLQARKVKVVALKHDLIKGDALTNEDLGPRLIFASDATGEEVLWEDGLQALDQKLLNDKKKASILRWNDVDMPILGMGGSQLAHSVKKKERALSVPVDNPGSVSGMIRPNDHVDIIGTFRFPAEQQDSSLDTVTLTILQNVTVLAVGQQLATEFTSRFSGRTSYSTLTLAVTPKEAEMLIFAQQKGTLTFTLRNPTDPYIEENIQDVNFTYLKDNFEAYTKERAERLDIKPFNNRKNNR